LSGSAASQRDDGGRGLLAGFTFDAPELLALDLTKRRLTVLCEELRNAYAGVFDDPLIEVYVPPANLPRQQPRYRGFPGAHKSG
jgi:hypothetical protein